MIFMKNVLLLACLQLFSSSARGASLPAPIAPAGEGQLQCYTPDAARKTCRSLAAYDRRDDGSIENTATVLIAPNPIITMTTVSVVIIRGDQVCGSIQKKDIDSATFSLNGNSTAPGQTSRLKQAMQVAMNSIMGKEICTSYASTGNLLRATATVDHVAQPGLDQQVMWVRPSDGYKVSP